MTECEVAPDELDDDLGTATMDPEVGCVCQECGESISANDSFCRHCGYYPTLGRCVEVDDCQPVYQNGQYIGTDDEPEHSGPVIPVWSCQLAGLLVSITAITAAGSWLTTAGSALRTSWALTQTGLGLAAFLTAHLWLGIRSLSRDKDLGILDLFTSPFRIWIDAIMDHPRSFRLIAFGMSGLTALVLAHGILGIPYGELINLNAKPAAKKKEKRFGGAAKMSGVGGKDMTMEEAMEEFAGKAGADQLAGSAADAALAAAADDSEMKSREVSCLVIGCVPASDEDDTIRALVVATRMNGVWRSIGTVSDGLTPEVQNELRGHVVSLKTDRPFVKSRQSAVWLQPKLHCTVEVRYSENEDQPASMKLIRLE